MRRIKLLSLLLAGVLLMSGCSLTNKGETVDTPNEETMDLVDSIKPTDNPLEVGGPNDMVDEVISVVGNNYMFADSDSHLLKSVKILDASYCSENIMISPLSLDFVLAMAANGADDETRKNYEMYFGQSINDFNTFSQSYLSDLSSVVEIANGIFVDKKYTVNDSTNKILEQNYFNKIYSLDFDNMDSIDFINNWCNESTHGLIDKIIYDLSGCESVLANALYFKDSWYTTVANVNENGVFMNMRGESETVSMMSFETTSYFENEKAVGFMKPYSNKKYGFVAILPKNEGEFAISDLDLDSFMSSKQICSVQANIPEFSFENKLSLTNVLQTLGLDVFQNGIYNQLINETDLVLSDVLQATKVKVDRNGTEAASVTVGLMSNTSVGTKEEIKYVNIDRPFAFMIYDFDNNVPLFIGKVVTVQ